MQAYCCWSSGWDCGLSIARTNPLKMLYLLALFLGYCLAYLLSRFTTNCTLSLVFLSLFLYSYAICFRKVDFNLSSVFLDKVVIFRLFSHSVLLVFLPEWDNCWHFIGSMEFWACRPLKTSHNDRQIVGCACFTVYDPLPPLRSPAVGGDRFSLTPGSDYS